jgi:integrase
MIDASASDRHRALRITALGTGLRIGELVGLRWEDVDSTRGDCGSGTGWRA